MQWDFYMHEFTPPPSTPSKEINKQAAYNLVQGGNALVGVLLKRMGESFSTLRRQMECGSRLFSSSRANIYKKY